MHVIREEAVGHEGCGGGQVAQGRVLGAGGLRLDQRPRLASIVGKDQYESPWSVVSVLKEKEGIDFDACATQLSTVNPRMPLSILTTTIKSS